MDYLKYDNCNNEGRPALERYTAMRDALAATGRPIIFSLCEWGSNRPWLWGRKVNGSLWRTTGDIEDRWTSVTWILDQQIGLQAFAGPGGWNDPDMLEVGNGGMNAREYRAHFSMWALLNAPLIAGNDIRSMNDTTGGILMNAEVIAVDQDWGGSQGYKLRDDGDREVWAKPMADGSVAVVLLNRGETSGVIGVTRQELRLPRGTWRARELWSHVDEPLNDALSAMVPSHGAMMYVVGM